MAISMTKWVSITSGSLPAGVSDRELILRLITTSENISPDVVYEMTTLADVGATFGTASSEYAIATKYFSFVSLTATKAEKISFWRPMPTGRIIDEPTTTSDGNGIGYCTVYSYKPKTESGSGGSSVTVPDLDTRTPNYMLVNQWLAIKKRIIAAGGSTYDPTTGLYWNVETSTYPIVYATADDYITSLDKMADASDNFATFFFVKPLEILDRNSQNMIPDPTTGEMVVDPSDVDWTNSANAVAAWCAAGNYRFRYVQQVNINRIAKQTGAITWQQIYGSDGKIDGPGSAVEYISRIKKSCVTAVLDDSFVNLDKKGDSNGTTHPEWLTCALLASTKYSRSNSTIIQEFKAFNSTDMLVTCKTDSLFKILSELNVNFFGQTQKAGQLVNFYMEGFNLDGTDTSVCDNEIWLKDRVTSEVFNRFVKCNKVPAGSIGRAMIKAAINGVISEGLNNLAVQPEKTISEADKAAIIQNTGATDAPAQIYSNGYYLAVNDGDDVVTNNAKHRVVDYILYYSTGEGIRKVTGSHVLV